ncbi:MAG: ABC transporter ATP-binding protein [Roseburia sp.]
MITFYDVLKQYNGKTVVDHLNFTIRDGEIVVLLGSSGCGKTTTLKMINRLEDMTDGYITVDNEDITMQDLISYRRKIGYVLQNTGLFPHMTVEENMSLLQKLEKYAPEDIEANNRRLLEMVNMDYDEYKDRYPHQLSGGQRQRIGVARAFALNPKIILMDEPFSAVDPLVRVMLQEELLKIQQREKKTIVFVTHDISEAFRIADKICIINQGKIVQYDTPENIVKNPKDEFVNTFIIQGLKNIQRTSAFMEKYMREA